MVQGEVEKMASTRGDAALPEQRHRQGKVSRKQLLRWHFAYVVEGVIFFVLSSTSSAPRGASRTARGTASFFSYIPARAVKVAVEEKPSLAEHASDATAALKDDMSKREGSSSHRNEEQRDLPTSAMVHLTHMWVDKVGLAPRSSGTKEPGPAASAEKRQRLVEQTASAPLINKSLLPESLLEHGGKHTYISPTGPTAFIQHRAKHGEQAPKSGGTECSCEIAGECLPKGSCVAVACVLVAFSILVICMLAWLLQWLSAIPAEWILAKRFRRRSLGLFTSKQPTAAANDDLSQPLAAVATEGAQRQQRIQQRGDGRDDEPLLEEQRTATADSPQGEHNTAGRYGSFATPVPKTENGRL